MCVYEPKRESDGTLFLTSSQRDELRKKGYAADQIYRALLTLYEQTHRNSIDSPLPANEGNLSPCPACGGVEFIPTGNCHACARCGESQGCS